MRQGEPSTPRGDRAVTGAIAGFCLIALGVMLRYVVLLDPRAASGRTLAVFAAAAVAAGLLLGGASVALRGFTAADEPPAVRSVLLAGGFLFIALAAVLGGALR